MNIPYMFFFDTAYGQVIFPITPGELTISNGSNNEVVTLINEGDVNILKSPSLIEINFEARFPTRDYPYTIYVRPIKSYHDVFTKLKTEKKPFKFIVARSGQAEQKTGNTSLLVSLENLETKESADEGDDVIYTFTLKQYKEYGVVTLPSSTMPDTTSSARNKRNDSSKDTSQQEYVVRNGDCLWLIAKKFYGNGAKWTVIYNANKDTIDKVARSRGLGSSSNGHWIFAGTKLIIPNATVANQSNSTSTKKTTTTTKKPTTSTAKTSGYNNEEYMEKGKEALLKYGSKYSGRGGSDRSNVTWANLN